MLEDEQGRSSAEESRKNNYGSEDDYDNDLLRVHKSKSMGRLSDGDDVNSDEDEVEEEEAIIHLDVPIMRRKAIRWSFRFWLNRFNGIMNKVEFK